MQKKNALYNKYNNIIVYLFCLMLFLFVFNYILGKQTVFGHMATLIMPRTPQMELKKKTIYLIYKIYLIYFIFKIYIQNYLSLVFTKAAFIWSKILQKL